MFELSHRLIGIYKTSNATRSKLAITEFTRMKLTHTSRYIHQQPCTQCDSNQFNQSMMYTTFLPLLVVAL